MASFLAGLGYYDHKSECLTRVGCNLVVTASVVLAITILFVSPQNGHASSTESPQLDPCDDFYEYVCQNESESIGQEHFDNYYKDMQNAFDKLAIWKLHGLPVGYHDQPNYVILIRDLYLECINQSSETVPSKLAKACLKEIQHDHIEVVLRIYADYVSNGSRSYLAKVKEKAIHLAKLVNETFKEMLTGDQSWLDAVTKARVKEKLKLIRPIIAYPDLSYDDDLLNFLYGIDYLPFIRNETFKSYLATNVTPTIVPWQYLLTENYTESKRLLSERKFDGYWYLVHSMKYEQRQVHYEFHDWKDVDVSEGSHFKDQHYIDSMSLLHIPLFELKQPYFDLTYPAIGNFAILGTILGHELTHGFDRQFRSYGFPPKMVYSDEAWIKFLDRANCLSRQYYQLPIDAKNPEFSFMVDGIDTLHENIADGSPTNFRCTIFRFPQVRRH